MLQIVKSTNQQKQLKKKKNTVLMLYFTKQVWFERNVDLSDKDRVKAV